MRSLHLLAYIFFVTFILETAQAEFTGTVTATTDETSIVQTTGVKYQFNLSFQKDIAATGKLVIRFPIEYTQTFSVSSCAGVSGLNSNTLTCSYVPSARLLEITGGFPNTIRQIVFTVDGIANPEYAVQTSLFDIRSYSLSATTGSYNLLESTGNSVKFTPTTGDLSAQTLSLTAPAVVGEYTTLTVSFTLEHSVPLNGQLVLTLPKWNWFAASNYYESFISVAVSPSDVPCKPLLGLATTSLYCVYTVGSDTDTLTVQLDQLLVNNIDAGTAISFSVDNFRSPPSMSAVSGFFISTTNVDGEPIDASATALSVTASEQFQTSPAAVDITADNPEINSQATLTIRIQNQNPLPAGSSLKITIPSEFDVSGVNSLTGTGSNIDAEPNHSFSNGNYDIEITAFNSNYLLALEFIYINVGIVGIPGQTLETSSFSVYLFDNNNNAVEYVDSGVTFTPTPGSIQATLTANDYTINSAGNIYTFSLTPADSFTQDAILKITFPEQVYIENTPSARLVNPNSRLKSTATFEATLNRYVVLNNAFNTGGYTSGSGAIEFGISGITNPPTIQTTDSFLINIYYEEGVNEVSELTYGLPMTAQPSYNLGFDIKRSSIYTGELNSNLTFAGDTAGFNVEKGSYVRVYVPSMFIIADYDLVASSCQSILGFTDEVYCEWDPIEEQAWGWWLNVLGGFASNNFDGGVFSFAVAGIQNPLTSQASRDFELEVYDELGLLQYYNRYGQNFLATPAPFEYAFVESSSPINGASSMYTVSLTLGTDTLGGSEVSIYFPESIKRDYSQNFTCNGTMNIEGDLYCISHTERTVVLRLMSNVLRDYMINNGTTVTFTLGYYFNPVSMRPSDNFSIVSYQRSNSATQRYTINKSQTGLQITNTVKGNVTLESIEQTGSQELGQPTSLQFKFATQNLISEGDLVVITVPTNFVFGNHVAASINGQAVNTVLDGSSRTFTLTNPQGPVNYFTIDILAGLVNPTQGPYVYDYFQIEVTDSIGYSIDQIISYDEWISVSCGSNCTKCEGGLHTCTECGPIESMNTTFYLFGEQCQAECPVGFYSTNEYTCDGCAYPCTQCRLAPDLCLECNSDFEKPYAYPESLTCYETCPEGTYLDTDTNLCTQCVTPCYTCESADKCLSCDRTDPNNLAILFYAQFDTCFAQCPSGSVETPGKQCLECQAPCKTCEDIPEQCSSCQDGFYFHNNACLETCPTYYTEDEETLTCTLSGEIPLPFTIITAVLSIGVGLSHFMKGSTNEGGTAFFATMIAFTDILLKIDWIILAILSGVKGYYGTMGMLIYCLCATIFINVGIWRRFFMTKYKFDQDRLFRSYMLRYPSTSKCLLWISYLVSFQAIKLTYSRLCAKKKFMAKFAKRKKFYRLIGRLSILSIAALYVPALVITAYSLTYIEKGEQIYYLDIDCLVMVTYCIILIIIVIKQREKILGSNKGLFDIKELFMLGKTNEDSDEEDIELEGDQLSMHSETNVNRDNKKPLYQSEWRYSSDQHGRGAYFSRAVSVLDYNEYRRLKDKHRYLLLKTTLFQKKQMDDEAKNTTLKEEYTKEHQASVELNRLYKDLLSQLGGTKNQISETNKERRNEIMRREQRKREETLRRRGIDVPVRQQSPVRGQSKGKDKLVDRTVKRRHHYTDETREFQVKKNRNITTKEAEETGGFKFLRKTGASTSPGKTLNNMRKQNSSIDLDESIPSVKKAETQKDSVLGAAREQAAKDISYNNHKLEGDILKPNSVMQAMEQNAYSNIQDSKASHGSQKKRSSVDLSQL